MYGGREPPQEPPCWNCRVELMENNRQAADLFLIVRNQVVAIGDGHIIDISIPAVKDVMEMFGVQDQKTCFMKIRRLFHLEREKHAN